MFTVCLMFVFMDFPLWILVICKWFIICVVCLHIFKTLFCWLYVYLIFSVVWLFVFMDVCVFLFIFAGYWLYVYLLFFHLFVYLFVWFINFVNSLLIMEDVNFSLVLSHIFHCFEAVIFIYYIECFKGYKI